MATEPTSQLLVTITHRIPMAKLREFYEQRLLPNEYEGTFDDSVREAAEMLIDEAQGLPEGETDGQWEIIQPVAL